MVIFGRIYNIIRCNFREKVRRVCFGRWSNQYNINERVGIYPNPSADIFFLTQKELVFIIVIGGAAEIAREKAKELSEWMQSEEAKIRRHQVLRCTAWCWLRWTALGGALISDIDK